MRLLCTLTVLLVLALSSTSAFAQKQYTIWYFGFGKGLDFSQTPPAVLTDGQTQSLEGSAVYCDPQTGELLFYTDGSTVWDRQHRIMPNGQGLIGNQSSTQSALIIPDPADSRRYYIFHSDHSGYISSPPQGLHYSILDLSRNSGFGEVTRKNIPLLANATEKLTAIQLCNGDAFWIISHEMYNNTFVAWYLDKDGITDTVRSQVGVNHGPLPAAGAGYLAASPDATMLVSAMAVPEVVEIYHFDETNGKISDPIRLPRTVFSYGASFSPDSKKLYISGAQEVTQYDITSWELDAIASSRFRLQDQHAREGAIKLGPDKKLYLQHGSHLGVIHKPNLSGANCEYEVDAIPMGGFLGMFGLPNNIDALEGHDCNLPLARIRSHSTNICEESCLDFSDSSRFGPTNFLWTFEGATPSVSTDRHPKNICYTAAGTYSIRLVVWNEFGTDTTTSTITIKACPKPEITLRDTTICIADCLTFKDTSSISTTTQWIFDEGTPSSYIGKTPPRICYSRLGTHRVRAIASNENGSDTAIAYVTVADCNLPTAAFIHDTTICVTQSLKLTDKSRNPVTSWEWSFEGGTPSTSTDQNPKDIIYSLAGTYTIRLISSNNNGSDTAYSTIRVMACDPPVAVLRDYEICQGDCIYLEDSSSNDPVSWEWQMEGQIPGLLTTSKPGQICYDTPGRFVIQLISRNLYGADTVRSNILVRPATGYATSSISLKEPLEACSSIDTFFWVYAGCKDNIFSQLTSDNPNILLPSATVTIRANDSLKVAMRIMAETFGDYTSSIYFALNGEPLSLSCNYSVRADKEDFTLSALNTEFITTHCDVLTRELTITNMACTEHEILRIYLESTSGITPFTLNYNGSSLKLSPGQTLHVEINYDPTQDGDTDPDLIIETADGKRHICPLNGVRMPLPEMSLGLRSASHNVIAGDEVRLELAFETAVGDTALPSRIDVTLDYNTDLISVKEIDPQNGWSLANQNEVAGRLALTFVRQMNTPIASGESLAQITFMTYLANEDSSAVVLSSVVCDPDNEQFAACILSSGYAGSGTIHVGALCDEEMLRESLGKQKQLSVIVQPNPLRVQESMKLTIHTAFPNEALRLELIDLSGKRIQLQDRIPLSVREEFDVELPDVSPGVYTLRVTSAGEQVTQQIVIY